MVSLNSSRFASAEYKNNTYRADIPVGHKIEDMLKPEYWAHISSRLRNGDEIKALSEDNSYFVHFIVMNAGGNWAKVNVINFVELSSQFAAPEEADINYIIEHSGNFHKFRVKRKADDTVLVAKLETREEAINWLRQYKKSLVIAKRPVETDAA